MAAGELKPGQHIRKADGSYGQVQTVELVQQQKQMYNLTVEQAHTFFVGKKQWLVHNTCNPNGNYYSTAFEMKLDPADYGKPRDVHFNRANAALEQALRSDSYFATELDKLSPGVLQRVSAQGGRENPLNFVWHHHSENGVMRLVPKIQHTPGSIFWGTLHQDGRGGYSIWAIPNGAPPNRRG